jgi:Ca2+-binding RTX toxin-like protein
MRVDRLGCERCCGRETGGDAEGDTLFFIDRVNGSTRADNITGNANVNYLRGFAQDDTLIGGAGNDYFQGDAGADVLDGGAGTNDWAYYFSSTVGLTVNLGNTALNTGEAIGDSYIDIENLLGSQHDDFLYGDANNNFVRGVQGDDNLYGGDGNDFLRGDQGADFHDGGNGVDWLYYATSSAGITIDLGAFTASGGDATGDTFANIERVYGSVHADDITGDAGANYLRGSSGNDTLNGGDGNDFLQGDSGKDTLNGGNDSDWAYYFSSGSTGGITVNLTDTSQNTGEAIGDTYISIENIVGSRYNDIIIGDSGDNYLRGAQGDDIINGGAGNDILRGEAGADTFVFEAGTGNDTVIDYDDAEDVLDFTSFGFTDAADALSNAADINGDVVFTIGTDVITIEDATVNEITDNLII